jgi:hypothetical protein
MKAMGLEANSGETEAIVEHQEVLKEQSAVEAIGTTEDRPGDRRPVVGYRNARERRTKGDVVLRIPQGRTFKKRRRA